MMWFIFWETVTILCCHFNLFLHFLSRKHFLQLTVESESCVHFDVFNLKSHTSRPYLAYRRLPSFWLLVWHTGRSVGKYAFCSSTQCLGKCRLKRVQHIAVCRREVCSPHEAEDSYLRTETSHFKRHLFWLGFRRCFFRIPTGTPTNLNFHRLFCFFSPPDKCRDKKVKLSV